jgi:hypothetical protein
MPSNLQRFKSDLESLIKLGSELDLAMVQELQPDAFLEAMTKKMGTRKLAEEAVSALPDFKIKYEEWYSQSLAVLRQLLPDRVENFVSHYQKAKSRKQITHENYVIQDYMQGLAVRWAGEIKVGPSSALSQFQRQMAILSAARSRLESSLYDIRQLTQADLFDSEIEVAKGLAKGKFYRASGAIAGVVLEKHLRQVCENHHIVITKKAPTISDLNELLKSNDVIAVPEWRHISLLGDIRNLSVHNKEGEPTADQIDDLLRGVEKIIKTIF